jgi:hypothetical protein
MTTNARLTTTPATAETRDGPWVRTVFQVPQPYPLPTVSAPRMSISAPPNIAMPWVKTPGTAAGSICCSNASLGSPFDIREDSPEL